ncbi:MAG: type II toxin-antitoxin system VapC family toxin [Magnetococcales bacterium]|nr:type II toxin-antitoxin system VapC family toxin [Magnetococcales bacterium]
MTDPAPLLLDTHVWLWMMLGDETLAEPVRERIREAARLDRVQVAAISLWEVAMLHQRGHLVLNIPPLQWIHSALTAPGITVAPLTPTIAMDSVALPNLNHKDPADRMILATARVEKAILLTRDQRMLDYASQGHVAVLAA